MQVLRPAEMTRCGLPKWLALNPWPGYAFRFSVFSRPGRKKKKTDYYPPIEIIADTKTILAVSIHQRRFCDPHSQTQTTAFQTRNESASEDGNRICLRMTINDHSSEEFHDMRMNFFSPWIASCVPPRLLILCMVHSAPLHMYPFPFPGAISLHVVTRNHAVLPVMIALRLPSLPVNMPGWTSFQLTLPVPLCTCFWRQHGAPSYIPNKFI